MCGAHRLGHATRLTDGMTIVDGKIVNMGSLAQYILDRRIPLEMCLSSNVHTGRGALDARSIRSSSTSRRGFRSR